MNEFITEYLKSNCGDWATLAVPFILGWIVKSPQALLAKFKKKDKITPPKK